MICHGGHYTKSMTAEDKLIVDITFVPAAGAKSLEWSYLISDWLWINSGRVPSLQLLPTPSSPPIHTPPTVTKSDIKRNRNNLGLTYIAKFLKIEN